MPLYRFECRACGTEEEEIGSMSNPPQPGNCGCGEKMFRIYGHHVDTFKPFWDNHGTNKPVFLETKEARDKFLDDNNLTYDTGRYVRRPQYRPAAADITIEDLDKELKENGPSEPFRGDPSDIPTEYLGD